MKTNIFPALRAYWELIQTGEISDFTEGDKIKVRLQGNITGDILIVISPLKTITSVDKDIYELIRSDSRIEQEWKIVLKSFSQKLAGLALLPNKLVWSLNIFILSFVTLWNYEPIRAICEGADRWSEIWSILPILLTQLGSIVFIKPVGQTTLKAIITATIQVIKLIRRILNKTVQSPSIQPDYQLST